ncbi:hypothetical protein MOX02_49190 [Methylobacterium oxalidis]|uniref:Uncharacterized protein n=1 Tax=Methylobacterium oxalidis TaxID=944322 RepID=A0A512JAB0_9HYPH|nr:hypothetical protein MOX02_49190 [Methylobacterium oxalidis]GLS65324.1 hypothetical protein GCM10007888_37060 [Methylobacterium oxalidis]
MATATGSIAGKGRARSGGIPADSGFGQGALDARAFARQPSGARLGARARAAPIRPGAGRNRPDGAVFPPASRPRTDPGTTARHHARTAR